MAHPLAEIAAVAGGGAVGAGLRVLVAASLPTGWSTIVVNTLGCVLLAVVVERAQRATTKAALGTGLAGALTTFSTFAADAVELLGGSLLAGLGYLAASIIAGLAGVWVGRRLARAA